MASISSVKIANMALSHIGASSQIESLADQTAVGKIANLWYDFSRLQVLEAHNWSFARKRQILTLDSEAADLVEWTYRYQYPADAVAIRELANPLGPDADAIPYAVEISSDGSRKTIVTNLESASAIYTKDLEVTSLYSAFFIEALSYLLAHHMAYSVTGKLSLRASMLSTYSAFMQLAPAQNANENVDKPKREAPWIRVR